MSSFLSLRWWNSGAGEKFSPFSNTSSQPFLNYLSLGLHAGLLLGLAAAAIVRRYRKDGTEGRFRRRSRDKLAVYSSIAASFSYLLFSLYSPCSSDKGPNFLASELDAVCRALSYLALAVYLHFKLLRKDGLRLPALLRVWLVVFLIFSICSLSFHSLYVIKAESLHAILLCILDAVATLSALMLNYAAFFQKTLESGNGGTSPLRDPLLSNAEQQKVSLFSNAGFFSVLTFSWMGPLLSVGYKKVLDLDSVPALDERDNVDNALPVFKAKLESSGATSCSGDGKITSLKLSKALIIFSLAEILMTAVFALVYTLATYVGPYLIQDFVHYLKGDMISTKSGYMLVAAFIVSKLCEGLAQRHWFFRLQQIGIRVQAVLMSSIYEKGLTLSSQSRQSRTSGEMINIMSVDAERIGLFSWYMHDLWLVILQVCLALLVLYSTVGVASVAALVATIVVMLANAPLGKLQEKYQEKLMECKDARMKSTSEILRNMRILKLQGWEMKFLSRIISLRNTESSWLKKYLYTSASVTFLFWGAPTFVAVITFGACLLLGIPLDAGKILSALATFRVLQEPIYNLPDTIAMTIQTKVSLDRISSFLCLEELRSDVVTRLSRGSSDVAIEVSDGSFSWDGSSTCPTLKDINFRVMQGMHVAVCGTVGAGKSSLLSCMLGEVPKISGSITLCGSTAYVGQSPWIQSGKIQDNILFGKEMDVERYNRVLEACSLKRDLEILPLGDQTIIGERGINLSGGQKQRIQIARALYDDADIFLFDDPFSAVDAHTGSHLFKECLHGLLAKKTVIYVTHQVEFLPSADIILVMKDGMIAQAGKYNEILDLGSEFKDLVGAHNDALASLDHISLDSVGKEGTVDMRLGQHLSQSNECKNDEGSERTGQLVHEEERESGKVGFAVYWRYITTAYGGALVPLILLSQILFQGLQIASNYWMAWAAPVSKDSEPRVSATVLIYVFVALSIGSSICVLARALLLVTAGYKTATLLFEKMHTCIFRAPMAFFDSTPSGRILNRASTDQSEVDTNIHYQVGSFAFSIIQLVGIVGMMSQVAWQVFVLFIPVSAACIWYQRYYIETARELARLVGVCKAPILQQFSESLTGATTIRSYGKASSFLRMNCSLIDDRSRPKFHNCAAMEWLCFRLDMLSCLTFAFSLVFLVSIPSGTIDPGIAGLAVTYGLNLNMLQSWVIWNLCNMENKIISVERIFQYMSIPSEPPLAVEDNSLDRNWLVAGEIELRNLHVRYAPQLPFVLRGLTCTFQGGMKTGIVGRTGSGKSTLIQTLFRIVEPTMGQILVDGIDICTIGLHDLRSRLSIIPQDPTMFEGTVRSNLDPLEEYSDEQIWQALDSCQLGEIRSRDLKLDSPVTENGENWSVGQRQLVCLGRVILKKSKILVLDEATASVDTATDNLIQRTLRQQFAESTVITIAHRITSVLDSDMVLLLDNGKIVEHDTPSRLLEDKSSLFSKLVMEYTMRSSYEKRSRE